MASVLVHHFSQLIKCLDAHAEKADDPKVKQVMTTLLNRCEPMTVAQCTPHSWSTLWTFVSKKIEGVECPQAYREVLLDMREISAGDLADEDAMKRPA